jgi:hypothetical protein
VGLQPFEMHLWQKSLFQKDLLEYCLTVLLRCTNFGLLIIFLTQKWQLFLKFGASSVFVEAQGFFQLGYLLQNPHIFCSVVTFSVL